ncbi:MAG: hypothetical protein WA087_00380 [Candidatus Saccharimonadales bacterium]
MAAPVYRFINSSQDEGECTMMPDNKPNNKKKIIIAAIAVVAFIAVAVGTVLILSLVNKKPTNNDTDNTQTVKTAADIKQEAIELIHSDKEKAKALLEEALAKYKADGDINGQIDAQSQLDLLEQTK